MYTPGVLTSNFIDTVQKGKWLEIKAPKGLADLVGSDDWAGLEARTIVAR